MKLIGLRISVATLVVLTVAAAPVTAQKQYDQGATDTEIKIGNIAPYTGQFSVYGAEPRAQAAYFRMINDRGGINGRKIVLVSVDDGSDPSNARRLAQQLIEQDGVLLLFSTLGSSGLAIRSYVNDQKVPQLFVQGNSSAFEDPAHFPWTMGFFASFRTEAQAYAKYIRQTQPNAKIGVLYVNDDTGNDYLTGLRDGLGEKASAMIVKEAVFKYSDPSTLDKQIEALRDSGANVFINVAIGSFATQAIRKAFDIGWHPTQFIPNGTLSVGAFLDPAGLEKATGIISNARTKDLSAPQSQSDPAVSAYLEWMRKYNPGASVRDSINLAGYERAQ